MERVLFVRVLAWIFLIAVARFLLGYDAGFGFNNTAVQIDNNSVNAIGEGDNVSVIESQDSADADDGSADDGATDAGTENDEAGGANDVVEINENVGADENNKNLVTNNAEDNTDCLLYTSPSPRDRTRSRMPSSA